MADTKAAPVGSLDELKRVKDVETEWAERLKAARDQAETTLKHLREEAEERVTLARTAASHSRDERVRAARDEADREAARILADGDQQARAALTSAGKRPAERREEILSAVLGEFRPD